jgi:hypothetical protein
MKILNGRKYLEDIGDLYQGVGVSTQNGLERAIYKGTVCGASCTEIEGGVLVGSIVEGVDGDGTEYHKVLFPFFLEHFWDVVQKVEDEASSIWDNTHGCEQCPKDSDSEYHIIDPNCPNCKGQGAII